MWSSRAPGFTLIDVLVSLSVIAILTAIMLPALSNVTKQVQRVQCASNMRQIGIGLQAYAYDFDGKLPKTVFGDTDAEARSERPSEPSPQDTLVIRPIVETRSGPMALWDNTGRLFSEAYVSSPDVFYCPAHTGEHPLTRYKHLFSDYSAAIVSNYQYRAEASELRLSFANSSFTLLANGMRTRADYSHVVGNNMLKSDGSVSWYDDPRRLIFLSLPETTSSQTQAAAAVPHAFEEMDRQVLPTVLPTSKD